MHDTLYVANVPVETTEEELRELFSAYGEVTAIQFDTDEKFSRRIAFVQMASEKVATKANHGLNGHLIGNQSLSVSYPDLNLTREFTAKQRKTAETIAAELGEKDEVPLRQIEAIIRLCGTSFAEALLKEAQELDAGGALRTHDDTRPRSKGGVFFYLARQRMAPDVRRIVYNRKGRLPEAE
ncbi:MAG TPA: hypothetical protein VHP83_18660 [Aggregatilineaceae bacterium]|nr:hypothetical protein [Aggregatilineaceae bacterium]